MRLTRHDDDNGQRIKVGQNVVGNTSELHGGAHLSQVGVHLSVGEPEDGNPDEHTASGEATVDLVYPGIVEVVPGRCAGTENRRLDPLPHLSVAPVLNGLDRVEGSAVSKSLEEQLHGGGHDTTGRRQHSVAAPAVDEDRESKHEHDGGKQEGEPETDVTLSICHGELTDQCTDVDEEVEVVVDTGQSDSGVDDDALSLDFSDAHPGFRDLLGDKRRNIGFETSTASIR